MSEVEVKDFGQQLLQPKQRRAALTALVKAGNDEAADEILKWVRAACMASGQLRDKTGAKACGQAAKALGKMGDVGLTRLVRMLADMAYDAEGAADVALWAAPPAKVAPLLAAAIDVELTAHAERFAGAERAVCSRAADPGRARLALSDLTGNAVPRVRGCMEVAGDGDFDDLVEPVAALLRSRPSSSAWRDIAVRFRSEGESALARLLRTSARMAPPDDHRWTQILDHPSPAVRAHVGLFADAEPPSVDLANRLLQSVRDEVYWNAYKPLLDVIDAHRLTDAAAAVAQSLGEWPPPCQPRLRASLLSLGDDSQLDQLASLIDGKQREDVYVAAINALQGCGDVGIEVLVASAARLPAAERRRIPWALAFMVSDASIAALKELASCPDKRIAKEVPAAVAWAERAMERAHAPAGARAR